jgi:hypothetical protein
MTGGLAACACLMVAVLPASADNQPALSGQAPASKAAPGMIIHIDPQTGAILDAPAPGSVPLQMTPDLLNALSTSHQGLVEAPSPVLGGGIIVDLQGRFMSPLVGTIDADGNLRIQHLHRPPAGGDTK